MPPSRVEALFSFDLGEQTFCRPMAAPDRMFLPWAWMMLTWMVQGGASCAVFGYRTFRGQK